MQLQSMRVNRPITFLLLLTPFLLVLLWHLCNRGLPNDDAANYAQTALQISNEFHQGVLAGVRAGLYTRGWRPIAFPLLAVPFVALTGKDMVAACAATLLLIYVALTLYLYRLARLLSGDPFVAAVVSSFVLSIPAVIMYSMVFFSESAWLLCSVAFVYHLLSSGPFKDVTHSLSAGMFGGLMAAIRPAESLVLLTVLVLLLIIVEIRFRRFSIGSSLIILATFAVPLSLLVISTWVHELTRFYILAACLAAVTCAIFVARRHNASVVAFFGALTSVTCMWWAGFMPALYAWIYETSFGKMAEFIDRRAAKEIVRPLIDVAVSYGEVQIALLAITTILVMVSIGVVMLRHKERISSGEGFAAAVWLLLSASGMVLMIFGALYAITGTGDPRRIMVGLVLFATSLFSVLGARSLVALIPIFFATAVQCMVIGSVVAATPVSAALHLFGSVPPPHRGPDGNVEVARILERYIPAGSTVAVYTLTLFQGDARVYEPAALQVASLQGNYDFSVGYLWDSGEYDDVIARLRRANYKYLLLDSFARVSADTPYVRFASELLRRTRAGQIDAAGLHVISRFQLGGREHVLFRFLPEISVMGGDNLAADTNGAWAIASDSQKGFPVPNLTDGTEAAWGSIEGNSDVYAAVVLTMPVAISEVRLKLFTPDGRPHLRNIRIVSAESERLVEPTWEFVRARLKGSKTFSNVITVPPLQDGSVVTIEIDRTDPHWHPQTVWGFACLRSQGDAPNYLSSGTGVYVRELGIK